MKPILKSKHNRHAYDEDRYTTAYGPKVTLCPVCINNTFEIHSEIRREKR